MRPLVEREEKKRKKIVTYIVLRRFLYIFHCVGRDVWYVGLCVFFSFFISTTQGFNSSPDLSLFSVTVFVSLANS